MWISEQGPQGPVSPICQKFSLCPNRTAAFTAAEGEALKATMGDVNASPEQKQAQLDAFIDGKRREIQTSQRELGGTAPQAAVAPAAVAPAAVAPAQVQRLIFDPATGQLVPR